MAGPVLAHRLVMGPEARVGGVTGDDIVAAALGGVRAPAI
jgi:hypothetical protein